MPRALPFAAAISLIVVLSAARSPGGPLTEAQVTKIINQVSLVDPRSGERPAIVRDVVKDDLGLETGVKSRSELLFQDNTLTRLGAETFFSFKTGTRDLTLEKGSMLLQVPKGLGGAKIHTAAVTAAITGTTIMMEYVPSKYIKVLVLEGSLRLSRNGLFGDSVVLTAGKMVIMYPDAKKIPEPVNVNIQHVVETSTLVNFPGAEPLPSTNLIQAAIEEQQKQLVKTTLVPTNLVIGKGTNVIVATNDQLAKLTQPNGAVVGTTLTGSTLNSVKNTVGVLPLVGSTAGAVADATLTTVTGTVGSALNSVTTAATDVLNSATGTISSTTNGLVGTAVSTVDNLTSTVTSIPVASTTQITSLLNAAVPSVTGTAVVVPTSIVAPVVTTTSSTVSGTTSTLSSAVSTVSGTLSGTTSTITSPTTTTTLTSPTTTLPISTGTITSLPTSTTSSPTSVLTSTTASPVTSLTSTATTTVTSLLGHH